MLTRLLVQGKRRHAPWPAAAPGLQLHLSWLELGAELGHGQTLGVRALGGYQAQSDDRVAAEGGLGGPRHVPPHGDSRPSKQDILHFW